TRTKHVGIRILKRSFWNRAIAALGWSGEILGTRVPNLPWNQGSRPPPFGIAPSLRSAGLKKILGTRVPNLPWNQGSRPPLQPRLQTSFGIAPSLRSAGAAEDHAGTRFQTSLGTKVPDLLCAEARPDRPPKWHAVGTKVPDLL